MTLEQGIVLGVIVLIFGLFAWGKWRYDVVAVIGLLALVLPMSFWNKSFRWLFPMSFWNKSFPAANPSLLIQLMRWMASVMRR